MKHPYPCGTRVRKVNTVREGDAHCDGAMATIVEPPSLLRESMRSQGMNHHYLGPLDDPSSALHGLYGYFVEWDDLPGVQVGVTSSRVEAVEEA